MEGTPQIDDLSHLPRITEADFEADRVIESVESHMIDFWAMDQQQAAQFSERLKRSGGTMGAIVHPFYDALYKKLYGVDDSNDEQTALRISAVRTVLLNLLKIGPDKTPPIVIFEEGKHIAALKDHLAELLDSEARQDFFIVPTGQSNGRIVHPGKTKEEAAAALREELHELGVQKILIGGGELHVNGEDLDDYEGCMAGVMANLGDTFDIQISALAYPHNRMHVKQAEAKDNSGAAGSL